MRKKLRHPPIKEKKKADRVNYHWACPLRNAKKNHLRRNFKKIIQSKHVKIKSSSVKVNMWTNIKQICNFGS